MNPTVRNLRYETKDLISYIDNLPDLGILTYAPYGCILIIPRTI